MKTISNALFYGIIIFTIIVASCKEKEVPVVSTSAIINITGTTATSGGEIIDEGSSTITARGVCWSTGNKPTIKDNITIDGAGAGIFVSNIPNLTPVTTYFVRAYATNSVGTGYGMAMSFTTMGQVPTSATKDATNLTVSSATLNGVVNANYLSTTVTFEYGTTTNYGQTISATQSPVTGNVNTNVTAELIGLAAGTTYHFRVKTVNSLGTVTGNDKTFTTLGQAPTATTQPVNFLTLTSATLPGVVNANYLSTTVTFEYGTSTSYGTSVPAIPNTVTGNSNTNVFADIMGLTEGTTYHFRIKAENSLGITYSPDRTFKTLGDKPIAITQAPSNIGGYNATLNGLVNASYLPTSVSFEYGTTLSYGMSVSAVPLTVTGNQNTSVSAFISGLEAGVTYHFRVKAENSLGISYGSDVEVHTFILAPTNGLVGYYPFNGNANDYTINANHGTVNGAMLTIDRFGKSNSAYFFDGINNIITGTTYNWPFGNSSRTLSVWVRLNTLPEANTNKLFIIYGPEADHSLITLYFQNSTINGKRIVFGGYNDDINVAFNYTTNTWYNVVGTFDGTIAKLYLNGTLIGQGNHSSWNTLLSDFRFGGWYNPTAFMNGSLDDVRIYNRALTNEEVILLYTEVP